MLHIILMLADWMFAARPPPTTPNFSFLPLGIEQRGADSRRTSFICIAWLGFKHHLVHVAEHATNIAMFYWQGQRDTNCTTICVQQHNRAGCDPLLLFLKCHLGEIWWTNDSIRHAPGRRTFPTLLISMWFVGRAGFETNVSSVSCTLVPHSHRLVSKSSEWNEHVKFVSFLSLFFGLFFFFWVWVDAWFGVGDSLGLLGLGEAITHLNKNDEPPSEPLCLPA